MDRLVSGRVLPRHPVSAAPLCALLKAAQPRTSRGCTLDDQCALSLSLTIDPSEHALRVLSRHIARQKVKESNTEMDAGNEAVNYRTASLNSGTRCRPALRRNPCRGLTR